MMSHEKFKVTIDALLACALECEHCATACLHEKDVQMMANCILMDRDCADICMLTARLLARESAHSTHLLAECTEACDKCATECEKHKHSEHCVACAKACRACAAACRNSTPKASK